MIMTGGFDQQVKDVKVKDVIELPIKDPEFFE